MSESTPESEAAQARFFTLAEALDATDPTDHQAMRMLWEARRRLDELTAMEIMKRPYLLRDLPRGNRVPESGGPATAAESLLWDSCARYERVAGLIEVYVGEERIFMMPVAGLRGDARQN